MPDRPARLSQRPQRAPVHIDPNRKGAPPITTEYTVTGSIATVRLDNPPVNGLGHATRAGIVRDLRRALAAPEVEAIVLAGSAGVFSAGADITELGTQKMLAEPSLLAVIATIEDADKPVIVAIEGTCLGGGLELALAAHYRIATTTSTIGLPEVKLGLVPGAGGTQRLPRVVDAGTALDMITEGVARSARNIADSGGQALFDLIVDGDLAEAAARFAQEIRNVRPLPLVRDRKAAPGAEQTLAIAREQLRKRSRGAIAPLAALGLVEKATTTSFDQGMAAEGATFRELLNGDQSAALRHAFFAERAARRIPNLPAGTRARALNTVAVIGAGTMGCGIAMNFLDAGIPVTVVETGVQQLERGVDVINRHYETQVAKGRLSPEELERLLALLSPSLDYADITGADLVIEAVSEDMAVKRAVFARLDEILRPGAVLASNTSTLNVDAIAAATSRPADVVGMHFFSPANIMALLEVVRGRETADDVLMTALAAGRRAGKVAVVTGVCDGFIGNRMLEKYQLAGQAILAAGASPAQIDAAIEDFGLAMGLFRMLDLAGNDIGWAIRKRRYLEHPNMPRDEISDALCEMGRFGQKTGGGFYDYEPGGRGALPSPIVEALLASFHEKKATQFRHFGPEEIVQRMIFALVDEGARILDEGIALRASDIDVVYTSGYGFPRHRGGPMFYADTVGLDTVLAALRRFAPAGWEPAPLLVRLAADGETFTSFDARKRQVLADLGRQLTTPTTPGTP